MKPESMKQFSQSPEPTVSSPVNSEFTSVNELPELPQVIESKIDILDLVEKWVPESSYSSSITNPETGQLVKVVDIAKIKELLLPDRYNDGNRISRIRIIQTLFEKHKFDVVLTPEQVSRADYQPKPLFYAPKSVEDGVDVLALADADFHIPLWDLNKNSMFHSRENVHPTLDGEGMSVFEARAAIIIFHPSYGDARRNPKDGKLYLKNPDYDPTDTESPKRIKFRRELIRSYGIISHKTGSGESRSMRTGFAEELPNLVGTGALLLEDIRDFTIRNGEADTTFESKKVGSNSYVMLRGVNQYVGRRFAGCAVEPFGDSKALVFEEGDDNKKLRAIFTIVDKDNVSDTYVSSNGNKIPRANADKTKVVEINYDQLVPEGSDGKTGVLLEQKRKEAAHSITQTIESLVELASKAEALVRTELVLPEDELQKTVLEIRHILLVQAERAVTAVAELSDVTDLRDVLASSEACARAYVALMQTAGVEKMVKQPLDVVPATNLSVSEREQMRFLLRENYESAYPGEDRAVFREEIAKSLETAFTRLNTNFYVLKDGDKIVSFNRFDTNNDVQDGRVVMYFGSFNADSKYRGVGSIMLEQTIQEKLTECDALQAHCDPTSDISMKYIEDGFIATNTETVAGTFSFEIWRSRDSDTQLVTKKMEIPNLLAVADQSHGASDQFFVRSVVPGDSFPELDQGLGYALTRYFKVNGKRYAVFEIPSASLYNRFTPARNEVLHPEFAQVEAA